MTDEPSVDSLPGPRDLVNLEDVLAAWQGATRRLEQTHEALRAEVARLTNELQIKNRELARKNRLADLGQIASHVAHEVRNNLVPVSLYTGLLRRRLSDDRGSLDVVDKIESGLTALDVTVHDLLNFTADREPQLAPVLLRPLIAELFESLAPQLSAQGVGVTIDVPAALVIQADRESLRRAVLNLVLNAVDAMPDGGNITATATVTHQGVELEIADDGPGLTEEAKRRAFEPFFTTKSSGIGLGLAIVYRLVEAHGGSVLAQNCPEGGAAFTIRLPRRKALEAAA
jgi:signal transduction histidine kinase